MITIIGNHVSPYVRKVLAALELKGIAYRVDPIIPFFGDERFAELSPLRRVPVLIDGDLVLPNSTVICEYLDEAYPGPCAATRRSAGPGAGALDRGIRRQPVGRCAGVAAVLRNADRPARAGAGEG